MRYECTEADVERFWSFVVKTETCWLFQGAPSQRYGLFSLKGKSVLAHRFAYQIQVGAIPPGLEVLHHCDVARCVRGDDLFAGTQQENIDDMMAKNRRPRGSHHWSRLKPDLLARGQKHGRTTKPEHTLRGERHPRAKLSDQDVIEIRSRYTAGGVSHKTLGIEYGLHPSSIGKIIRMRARKVALT